MLDIIIIGGGIVGVSIAQYCARFQLKILLLEKEAELSFGVSKSNSGIIHTGFQSPAGSLSGTCAVRGNALYAQLSRQLQFPFKRTGELIVGFAGDAPRLTTPHMQRVNAPWLREHEPALSGSITCALLGESAGVVNPYEAIYALAENAVANGVTIRCEHAVTALQYDDATKRWEVKTQDAAYQTKIVINSAGLYADMVSEMAGIPCEKITPRKGEEFLLDRHLHDLPSRIIFPLPEKNSKGILIIPTVDHNAMIGPTATAIENKDDLRTSAEGKSMVFEHAKRLVPSLKEASIIASFAGNRPATASGDFHIQEDAPGLINCLGIQSPGLTAAPAIGEMVGSIIRQALEKQAGRIVDEKKNFIADREPIPRFRELSSAEKNKLIRKDPAFGEIVCRCEAVTRGEILEAIRRGARTLDGIKFRTRSQMGRCHGAFCTMKLMHILATALDVPMETLTKRGKGSEMLK